MKALSFLLCALVALIAISPGLKAFTEISTVMRVEVQPDAWAHVKETYVVRLDQADDVETFESLRKYGQNTLISWRNFLPILRYHIASSLTPNNTTISARRLFEVSSRTAEIELDYDVAEPIFSSEKVGSRTKRFSLQNPFLNFQRTASGEALLSGSQSFILVLPPVASFDPSKFIPSPTQSDGSTVRWSGPASGVWRISYEIEKPLGDEVSEYFSTLYAQGVSAIPAFLPLGLVALLAAFLFSRFAKNR
ncbi:hypothetical protein HY095_05445 [Candidatus Micrarchaeota archaeon]|nr:hypothetical protein [Candidatus Micrarchaeota archaeon]